MSEYLSGIESDDEGIRVGTPTLSEIREHFANYQYYTAESSASDSSGELSESFTELLEKRKKELIEDGMMQKCKYLTQRVQKTPVALDKSPESQVDETFATAKAKSAWTTVTEDDSFLAAEKMCEQTLDYNRYMCANRASSQVLPHMSYVDETILNDVEPPSMLCEQTMIKGTMEAIRNRPSTIAEENTIVSSDCSFYTADLARTLPRISSGNEETETSASSEEATGNEVTANDVIELSDESAPDDQEKDEEEQSEAITEDSVADDVSSLAPSTDTQSSKAEQSALSLNLSQDFNDTLERVEYLMKKSEKVLPMKMPLYLNTPSSSSSSGAVPKKLTPVLDFKKPTPKQPTKIPQIRNKNWDHIKSPISAYIHKTPVMPLIASTKGLCEKIEDGARSPRSRYLESKIKEKENVSSDMNTPPKDRVFPKKACVSAPYAVQHDERVMPKIPGGPKMQKLLGNDLDQEKTPALTKRMARYKTQRLPPALVEAERRKLSLTEDSIGNLSVISGDVSVHVMKNAMHF
ncbi:uncharacterized protein LOC132262464 [Phlebotomus argentipes]|uniref:uncharacterized protein LOC132262464 n=1 Tax=Phlebotomus argentipes TaxID=94469 RepID=UPI0028933080|nr:uncharacterized protein LOC132262464 [Phlebotomus argentipes]